MDVNDKSAKSCAIKVHLANLIKRKSHVTLVVLESSVGLTIKKLAMKKIGMNEHQIMSTELFVSVKDSFRSFPNHEDDDGSNFFHVLDADCPGHYVNLRLCEFHLYWKDSLPQSLENPVNISKFQSRASLGDKLSLAAKKHPFDQSSNSLNGQLKSKSSNKEISQLPLPNTFSQNYTKNGVKEIEKSYQNKINSSTLSSSKSNLYKSETELNGNRDSKPTSITSEIKCRPSLLSVKKALAKSKEQEALKTVKEVHNPVLNKNVFNSPSSSSYSSSSLERKNSLSMSMPVLNKYTIKDKNKTNLPVGDQNFMFTGQKVSSKSNLSDTQQNFNFNNGEKLAVRRQLPRVTIPDDVVEEKRYLLSKKLERKLSRRATIESKKFEDQRPVQKCNSLMSWNDVIKFNREDSEDTGSIASQEVAEILAEAGPMGMAESDYEEPRTSALEDDDIASCSSLSKSNTFHSLFDSMKEDPLNDFSDFDDGKGTSAKSASLLDSSMASSKDSSFAQNFTTTSSHGISPSFSTNRVSHNIGSKQLSSDRQLERNFSKLGSVNSNFVLYSQLTRQSIQDNTLTLFDILSLGYMKLFPLTISLLERRTVGTRSRYLPFEVLSDVIRLKSIQGFNDKECHEVVKTFAALKISEVSCNDSINDRKQLSKFDENSKCQLGDLLVEVNHTNVLGFSVSQFIDFASKTLSNFNSIQVVVARPLKPS